MSRAKPYQPMGAVPNSERNCRVSKRTVGAARDQIAGIGIEDRARTKLERLCRYVSRPAV